MVNEKRPIRATVEQEYLFHCGVGYFYDGAQPAFAKATRPRNMMSH